MIYFVGIHHKPGLPALCSTTQSGKKIDAVTRLITQPYEKINLFSTDHIPNRGSLAWHKERQNMLRSIPLSGCTIVLLGKQVENHFPSGCFLDCKIIKFRHPAFSPPSFVDDLVKLINES